MRSQVWQAFSLLYLYLSFGRRWVGRSISLFGDGLDLGPYIPMETTLLQCNDPKQQLGRVFGARSTLLTGGSPLGLATVIALSAFACILVGLSGFASPTFRSSFLPSADSGS